MIDPKDPDVAALVDSVVEQTAETIRRIVARDGQVPILAELRRELRLDLGAPAPRAAVSVAPVVTKAAEPKTDGA